MPFYSYKCSFCKQIFETFHGMSETIKQCEICNKEGGIKKNIEDLSLNIKTITKEHIQEEMALKRIKKNIEEFKEDLTDLKQDIEKHRMDFE